MEKKGGGTKGKGRNKESAEADLTGLESGGKCTRTQLMTV